MVKRGANRLLWKILFCKKINGNIVILDSYWAVHGMVEIGQISARQLWWKPIREQVNMRLMVVRKLYHIGIENTERQRFSYWVYYYAGHLPVYVTIRSDEGQISGERYLVTYICVWFCVKRALKQRYSVQLVPHTNDHSTLRYKLIKWNYKV